MLANALITKLPTTEGRRAYFEYWFLKALNGEPKLILMGVNQEFFINILKDDLIHPAISHGQKLLSEGYEWIKQRINILLKDGGPDTILKWPDNIRMLEVLEFIEADEGKARRMFQSVNDRGAPLSNMDKAKSILIYYSNRFLSGRFDDHINVCFGVVTANTIR